MSSIAALKQQNLYRQRHAKPANSKQICFANNDYLGLSQHPLLIEAGVSALKRWGAGSGGSHLLAGHKQVHAELEYELARWLKRDAALLYSTGYMANIGMLQAHVHPSHHLYADHLNHASLTDGMRIATRRWSRYKHNDLADLERQLKQHSETENGIIISDGVFSMDGDRAQLAGLSQLAMRYQSQLWIDEAHSLGVYGFNGTGVTAEAGLDQTQVRLISGMLGKAFGCSGGFVAGAFDDIEWMVQKSRSYIYTTALPPSMTAMAHAALKIICSDLGDALRKSLQKRIQLLRDGLSP